MAVVTAVEEVAAVDLEAALLAVGVAAEASVEDAEEEVMDLTEDSEVAEEVAEAVTEEVVLGFLYLLSFFLPYQYWAWKKYLFTIIFLHLIKSKPIKNANMI